MITAPHGPPQIEDIEALIDAARRRQRRRRRGITLVIVVLAALVTAGYLMLGPTAPGHRASARSGGSGPVAPGSRIGLVRPGALALGAHGALYIADDGRDQIIERLPDGTMRIAAGTGIFGFSGDGGPAVRAELNRPAGMAVGRDDTLYFADEANDRVRAIAPDGVMSTVAGGGTGSWWIKDGTPARAAKLAPAAVAIGPDGRLYIADGGSNQVLRLERNGKLMRVAGNAHYGGVMVHGIGHPAMNQSPANPDGLAFDRAGNLFLAGFSVKTLLMITATGIMTLPDGIGTFYPRGDGGLTSGPNGEVYATNTQSIVRLTPRGAVPVVDLGLRPFSGIAGFLPEGIAVAPNGAMYTDTSNTNGFANRTALVLVRPSGKPEVLWKGPLPKQSSRG